MNFTIAWSWQSTNNRTPILAVIFPKSKPQAFLGRIHSPTCIAIFKDWFEWLVKSQRAVFRSGISVRADGLD